MSTLPDTTTEPSPLALIEAAHRHLSELPHEAAAVVEFVRKRLEEMDLAPLGARSVEQQADLVCELAHQLFREVSRTPALEDAVSLLSSPGLRPDATGQARQPGLELTLRLGIGTGVLVGVAVAEWVLSQPQLSVGSPEVAPVGVEFQVAVPHLEPAIW
jgi:hypothetical protein